MDLFLEILKWITIVFLAGVIGQLGKSLTIKILSAKRRTETTVHAKIPKNEPMKSKDNVKQRKKEAKLAAKTAKKQPD